MRQLTVTLRRLADPVLFRVNFTLPRWRATQTEARGWALVSVVAGLLALALTGEFAGWSVALTLLSPLGIWWLPARLACAGAFLYITQALGGLGMVLGLEAWHIPPVFILTVTVLWQVWCTVAAVALFLNYVRTPKAAMV